MVCLLRNPCCKFRLRFIDHAVATRGLSPAQPVMDDYDARHTGCHVLQMEKVVIKLLVEAKLTKEEQDI